MNAKDIIDNLSTRLGITKKLAHDALANIVDQIRSCATDREDVYIKGLGVFKVKDYPEHWGRDPRTGEKMRVAAKTRLTFRPSGCLRDI